MERERSVFSGEQPAFPSPNTTFITQYIRFLSGFSGWARGDRLDVDLKEGQVVSGVERDT
eukprot:m.142686 g.142686  ORF g.142686 m.142686 type:complete len:60 (-) comp22937_c0_seq2:82-261(-)